MILTVNGEPQICTATTLSELIEALDLGKAKVATAINGAFVPAVARPRTTLCDGDKVEIVAPMQGG